MVLVTAVVVVVVVVVEAVVPSSPSATASALECAPNHPSNTNPHSAIVIVPLLMPILARVSDEQFVP